MLLSANGCGTSMMMLLASTARNRPPLTRMASPRSSASWTPAASIRSRQSQESRPSQASSNSIQMIGRLEAFRPAGYNAGFLVSAGPPSRFIKAGRKPTGCGESMARTLHPERRTAVCARMRAKLRLPQTVEKWTASGEDCARGATLVAGAQEDQEPREWRASGTSSIPLDRLMPSE